MTADTNNSYLYIKDARQDNLKVAKGFRSQGVHNIFEQPENL
jgi:hypothetical protein